MNNQELGIRTQQYMIGSLFGVVWDPQCHFGGGYCKWRCAHVDAWLLWIPNGMGRESHYSRWFQGPSSLTNFLILRNFRRRSSVLHLQEEGTTSEFFCAPVCRILPGFILRKRWKDKGSFRFVALPRLFHWQAGVQNCFRLTSWWLWVNPTRIRSF